MIAFYADEKPSFESLIASQRGVVLAFDKDAAVAAFIGSKLERMRDAGIKTLFISRDGMCDSMNAVSTAAQGIGIQVVPVGLGNNGSVFPTRKDNAAIIKQIHEVMETRSGTRYAVIAPAIHTDIDNQTNVLADQAEGIDKTLGIPCVTFITDPDKKVGAPQTPHRVDESNYRILLPDIAAGTSREIGR